MLITLTFTKKELFDLINSYTVQHSDIVGDKKELAGQRLAEVIPLTEDDYDFFNTKLYSAAKRVYTQLAYNVDSTIEDPYIVSGNDDPEYPDPCVIFRFNLYDDANEKVVVPMVQQAVAEFLINYIIQEWFKVKGFNHTRVENDTENSRKEIKSAMMYGQRTTKTYRTL